MEKCSVRVREVNKRSDEFGKTVGSAAEIQLLGSFFPVGCPPCHSGVGINNDIDSNSFSNPNGLEGRRDPALSKQCCPEVFEEVKDIQN